jgi:flagellar basal body rod protein FlgG
LLSRDQILLNRVGRTVIRGLYNSAAAIDAATLNHEVVAGNLAHASMPGFRRRTVTVESFDQALSQASAGQPGATPSPPLSVKSQVVFDPGEIVFTGARLDVALRGNGFFVLEGPNGPLYTRNGVFQVSGDGELQSTGGLPVSGTSGKVSLPSGAGEVTIREDGSILADGTPVGQLQIANFDDPSSLRQVGTTLFDAPPGVRPGEGTSTVHQGFRENSNVEVVTELVQMIAGMRQYEAAQRVMRAISDSIQQNTNPQAG